MNAPGALLSTSLLFLAAPPSEPSYIRGEMLEQSAICVPDGTLAFPRKPMPGRRLVARPGRVTSAAPPAATATTDAAGHYELAVPDGVWCVSEEGRAPGTLCDVQADLKGGSWSSQIIRHAPGPPPKCVPTPEFAKHAVQGTVTLATEACGDAGLPARPLPGKKLYVRDGDGPKARIVGDVTAGADGRFRLDLRRGDYCFVREEKGTWVPPSVLAWLDWDCRTRSMMVCDGRLTVGDGPVDGFEVHIVRTCGDPCVRGDEKLAAQARGVGRAAAHGAARHVRGTVKVSASWWSGVPPTREAEERRRNPPPTPGELVTARAGVESRGQAPLAQIVTDGEGRFDLAVPAGPVCLQSGFREQYFAPPPKNVKRGSDFDQACLAKERAKCDAVIAAGTKDVDGVEIRVHHPSPPDAPCRVGPYTGSYPPRAAPGPRPVP